MRSRLFTSRFLLIGLIAIYVVGSGQALGAGQSNGNPVAKVMTQNVYLGADLGIILEKLFPPPPDLVAALTEGTTDFFRSVLDTDFTERLWTRIARMKTNCL